MDLMSPQRCEEILKMFRLFTLNDCPKTERLVQAKNGYKKLPLLLWLSFLLDVVDVVAFQ